MSRNIQILSNKFNFKSNYFKISSFNHYESFNSFKFNIIDLNYNELWNYPIFNYSGGDLPNLKHLINALSHSTYDTTFIILLPQNIPITTKESGFQTVDLMNNMGLISKFISKIIGFPVILIYGNNVTVIEGIEFNADFYFKNNPKIEKIVFNNNGDATVIKIENFIFTTIIPNSLESLNIFINEVTPSYKEFDIPDWFNEINYLTDKEERENIESYKNQISMLKENIKKSTEIIEENNKYKSILYTQGNALEKIIYEMMEQMLNMDLSDFEDVYDEDLYFEIDEYSFVVEIKGVKSNLKNEFLNQLNDHAVKKLLMFDEAEIERKVKQIMIINTFRKQHPHFRLDIEDVTIEKAKNNEALVITTPIFLKLFEMFKKGEIDSTEIIEYFKKDIGLFEI